LESLRDQNSTSRDSNYDSGNDKYASSSIRNESTFKNKITSPYQLYHNIAYNARNHWRDPEETALSPAKELDEYGAFIDNSTSLSAEATLSMLLSNDSKLSVGLKSYGVSSVLVENQGWEKRPAEKKPNFDKCPAQTRSQLISQTRSQLISSSVRSAHDSNDDNGGNDPEALEGNEQRGGTASDTSFLGSGANATRDHKKQCSPNAMTIIKEASETVSPRKVSSNLPAAWNKKINLPANLVQADKMSGNRMNEVGLLEAPAQARLQDNVISSEGNEKMEQNAPEAISYESELASNIVSQESKSNWIGADERADNYLPVYKRGPQSQRHEEAISNNSSNFAVAAGGDSGVPFTGAGFTDGKGMPEDILCESVNGGLFDIGRVSYLLANEATVCPPMAWAGYTKKYRRASRPAHEIVTDLEVESREESQAGGADASERNSSCSSYRLNNEVRDLEEVQERLIWDSPSGFEIQNSWVSAIGKGAVSVSSISEMTEEQKAGCIGVCMNENLHNLNALRLGYL
jgi:hypothetical protein